MKRYDQLSRRDEQALVEGYKTWLLQNNYSADTSYNYYWTVKRYRERLRVRILKAKPEDLLGACPNYSASQKNKDRQALRLFYRFVRTKLPSCPNPAAGLGRVPSPKGLPKPYNDEERRRYLLAAHTLGLRYMVLACLGVYGGLRIAEASKVSWKDYRGYTLRVIGKFGKERDVPVAPALKQVLDAWRLECSSTEWVLPRRKSGKRSPGAPIEFHVSTDTSHALHHEILKKAGMYTGLKGKDGFHRTRHTAGTGYYRACKDIYETAKFLGHSRVDTTVGYALLAQDEMFDTVKKMYG